MDENEDPVVSEIKIFLHKPNETSFFLVQAPLKPKLANNIHYSLASAIMKKNCKKMLFEYYLKPERNSIEENDSSERVKYLSCPTISNPNKFSVGFYEGGNIYLTPVDAILDSKPDFNQIRKISEQGNTIVDDAKSKDSGEKINLLRVESEDVKKNRMRSYDFVKAKEENEPWTDLRILPLNDKRLLSFQSKFYEPSLNIFSNFMMTPREYMNRLIGSRPEIELPFQDEVNTHDSVMLAKNYIYYCQVFQYSALKMIDFGENNQIILDLSLHSSVLVQGSMVIKSEHYLNNWDFKNMGIDSDFSYICACRDFILWSFVQCPEVDENNLLTFLTIPPFLVREILQSIAIHIGHFRWRFAHDPDFWFIQNCHQYIEIMAKDWAKILINVFTILKIDSSTPDISHILSLLKNPSPPTFNF